MKAACDWDEWMPVPLAANLKFFLLNKFNDIIMKIIPQSDTVMFSSILSDITMFIEHFQWYEWFNTSKECAL